LSQRQKKLIRSGESHYELLQSALAIGNIAAFRKLRANVYACSHFRLFLVNANIYSVVDIGIVQLGRSCQWKIALWRQIHGLNRMPSDSPTLAGVAVNKP